MSWLDVAIPVRMRRVAVVAPAGALRDVLVRVADAAAVEIGPASGQGEPGREVPGGTGAGSGPGEAARRLAHAGRSVPNAALCASRPDLAELEQTEKQGE